MTLLHPDDVFPSLTVMPVGGAALQLPDAVTGHFAAVLFYRGSWCPYCNGQLRAFARAHDSLAVVDAKVVALSVDDESTTQALIAKLGLNFPVGYSADAKAVAEATGAFVNPDPMYLQSTGFVLDPGGRVVVSVYSSGAIGRLVPEDVVGLIRYLRDHAAAA
ncbi:MAG: redoxin domain-containing protein [Candidatus Dormiibacterota bacterium]